MKRTRSSGLYHSVLDLTSPTLTFSRDGRRLLAVEPDGVAVADLRGSATVRIATEHVLSVAAFADQIWIARGGATPVVERYATSGASLGAPIALPISEGSLIAAAVGDPAAVWKPTASPGIAIVDERTTVLPPADVVIPLTGRRHVLATGARVVVPSGLAHELAPGTRVLGGAIVLDGTAVAIVGERAGVRELSLIVLASGRPVLRQQLPHAPLRFATRRGFLVVRVESRRFVVGDLRTGRVLGEVATDVEIDDLAVDPNGDHVALRSAGTTIELVELAPALAARKPAVEVGDVGAAETSAATTTHDVPTAAPAPSIAKLAITRPLALRGLAPAPSPSTLDRAAALALLDREVRSVALRAVVAISEAWDTHRLGYGNEGAHPYEHEVAALVGLNRGFATDYVAAARANLAEHEAGLEQDRRSLATPLGVLAAEFGLSPLAIEILLVIAAPAMASETARLYGVLANDPDRALVDEALVEQLLAGIASRHDIAAELESRAPLVRFGIVDVDHRRRRPFSSLVVDPIIIARLRRETPELAGVVVRGSDRALEELAIAPGAIAKALDALGRATTPARIALQGKAGAGRRTFLAALAAEAQRALGVIDAALLSRRAGLAPALERALRQAQLAGLLPCVVGLEDAERGERSERDAIVEVLRVHAGPVAAILPANCTAPFDAGHLALELHTLDEGARVGVWERALRDAGLAVADVAILAARYRIGPGTIQRAIGALDDRTAADATPALENYLRQTRDATLGNHARRVERLGRWDQLVLPPDITDSLRELVSRVRHRRTVFETWGMGDLVATSRGLTALFSGPPGTGKTLVAGVIARELGLDLYQVDLSKLMSKWIGETERNLAAVFDAAEDGQVVLLFDEADSLFAKRTEVRSSNDRYANLEVNYLLQRLDTFEGIAILTTNASRSIDPAFQRRMSFRLSFPFPDEETREHLWRAHLPASLPIAGALELDRLARKYQLSGGYIRNACLRAAFLAAQDATALTHQHLERAVTLEFAELGKLSSTGSLD